MNRMHAENWLFGYGSILYKTGFAYQAAVPARLEGWARRFWQGSHDHRGTPRNPGRVVTLYPAAGEQLTGIAYRIPDTEWAALDHREKNGYERTPIQITLADGKPVAAITYLARPGNPAWLGPAPLAEMARQIAESRGPSGANRDYLEQLAAALEKLQAPDPHVSSLLAALHDHDLHRV